jgi:hypothetical protein
MNSVLPLLLCLHPSSSFDPLQTHILMGLVHVYEILDRIRKSTARSKRGMLARLFDVPYDFPSVGRNQSLREII